MVRMRKGKARWVVVAGVVVAFGVLGVFIPSAGARVYRGTVDEQIFQTPRPTTEFAFQVKGKRARLKSLVLALECTPDDQKDPRMLVPISTPFRRLHTVLRNHSYDFDGTVPSPAGAIKFETTISINVKGAIVGDFSAKLGSCVDGYVNFKAR